MRIFKVEELPYDDLFEIGITKEDFLNLPINIMDSVLLGRLSPVMMLKIKVDEELYSVKGKFAFEREVDDSVQVKVYPVRNEMAFEEEFTEEEIELLKNGRIIKKKFPNKEGKKVLSYIQLDPETLSILSIPISMMFIPSFAFGKELTGDEKEKIKNGELLEIENDDKKHIITVDLIKSKNGILTEQISAAKWRMDRAIEWDRINPNAMGYWCTSQNGWEYKDALERQNGLKL